MINSKISKHSDATMNPTPKKIIWVFIFQNQLRNIQVKITKTNIKMSADFPVKIVCMAWLFGGNAVFKTIPQSFLDLHFSKYCVSEISRLTLH